MNHVLAADVGGTKLAVGVVAVDGSLLVSRRAATPLTDDPEVLFAALAELCHGVLASARLSVQAIGVGCAGPMHYPQGRVSPLNMPAWRDFPLKSRLEQELALPCLIDNDAKAMALGEHWLGAGRGVANMIGMVVSTGVGAGIILNGHLLHGASGNAGHLGHVVVWPNGPPCACGARGCVEAIASGTSLAARLASAQLEGAATTLPRGSGAAQIAQAARSGDELALQLFQQAGEAVGRGIASAAALLDVELVAIGGSVALKAWDLLGPPLESELRRSAQLGFTRHVRVLQSQLGDQAGLLGAAALALAPG